ncbi:2OG-Fe(II) oxygenase [Chlorogloeopsis sp. ULAP01]|uniref:2OG-Fe(II) oxygenase n=1 Tax=Chlorogloeopsis sp. ULAP01 TaxID=3056483 RepID=UPI0025AB159B|nr:2OG-Fe(II) oxygenase [Chlorogloeopsis sp. ULAP01]MDM9379172.1 2OG-Fe(II) oxygenase [Chlorogloeopsis sp. ULAP01]
MNNIVQQVRNRILRKVHQISFLQNQSEQVYLSALEKHSAYLPAISTEDLILVETIKREGVAIASLESLSVPSTDKMLQATKSLIPKIPKTTSGSKNEYVVHATCEQMLKHPEIFLWGLEQRLVNIVEHYLGLPAAYHGPYFRRDLANQVERKSRLWHIDTEDRKILKIIVYLNDVSEDCGPFQYIPQYLTDIVASSLKYQYGYIGEKRMQRALSSSYWKSCTGSAGTVVFAATASVFHRGKIPQSSDRFTVFFDYTSRQPKYPFYCHPSLPRHNLMSLASQFSEQQKQCIFWV